MAILTYLLKGSIEKSCAGDKIYRAMNKLVEEIIERAIEAGGFDNLSGSGEPLDLDAFPHQEADLALAYKLLKDNGFSLPWIEMGQCIEADLAKARAAAEQDQDFNRFETDLQLINAAIRDYNLAVPLLQFQKSLIDLEEEVRRLGG